jgi:putative ABC transport system permease protein
VSPEYGIMRTETAEAGRFLNAEDVANRRRVCFLGYEVARKLFSHIPAVGETVRIAGVPFEVIGVMPNKAQISNYFYPDKLSVFIPYTAFNQVFRTEVVGNVLFQPTSPALEGQAVRQVRELLASRHHFDPRDERAVNVRDTSNVEAMIGGITGGLQVILYFIGALTLMIGGVGVMNIMLVSVTERTREIGLRMAVGARGKDILAQFLVEAVTLSLIGGVIGVGAGLLGSHAIAYFAEWRTLLQVDAILLAFGFSAAVGIFFGFYPARKAAGLNPIDALRYE